MTINRNTWDAEERAEYDQMISEIVAATSVTGDRLDLFEQGLADAIQAQRMWARDVERACVRAGLAKEIKNYQDRNRAMVAHNGVILNLPKVQGTVARGETGQVHHQRELIELWNWPQILDKRAEALRSIRHYDSKVAHYDRLLALRDMCPDSATPTDAARQLHINLDEFLGTEVAA